MDQMEGSVSVLDDLRKSHPRCGKGSGQRKGDRPQTSPNHGMAQAVRRHGRLMQLNTCKDELYDALLDADIVG